MCDPVLLCGGRGTCSSDHSDNNCDCLTGTFSLFCFLILLANIILGLGFTFYGANCEHKKLHLVGTYIIILIVLFYVSTKVVGVMLLRRRQKQFNSENTPLIASLDSNAIRDQLLAINLSLENVELEVGTAKLLRNMNLLMKSGELTAIIGIIFYILF